MFISQVIYYHNLIQVLACTYALLENKGTVDVINLSLFLCHVLYKADRLHVAIHLFRSRSQEMSRCGENITETPLMAHADFFCFVCFVCFFVFFFLPQFDMICDLPRTGKK